MPETVLSPESTVLAYMIGHRFTLSLIVPLRSPTSTGGKC